LSAELTKTHSFRRLFRRFCPRVVQSLLYACFRATSV